jgi:hypothetical protein
MEQIGSNLRDTNNPSMSSACKVKTSTAALWSLICSIAGLLIFSLLTKYGHGLNLLAYVSFFVSYALEIIGLILGIISLARIRSSVRLKGMWFAVPGIILSAIIMLCFMALIIALLFTTKL